MTLLVIGLVVFLGIHSVAVLGLRESAVARLGEGPWKGLYSLAAAIGLGLIVFGYARARQAPVYLYTPPYSLRIAAIVLLAPVFPLLFAAYLPGRIRTATRHPMLLATMLWGVAHLFANGMLADVLLFGGFAAWALVDRFSLDRRPPRTVPGAPPSPANDTIVVVGGLLTYVVFLLWGHRWLIGVAPI